MYLYISRCAVAAVIGHFLINRPTIACHYYCRVCVCQGFAGHRGIGVGVQRAPGQATGGEGAQDAGAPSPAEGGPRFRHALGRIVVGVVVVVYVGSLS